MSDDDSTIGDLVETFEDIKELYEENEDRIEDIRRRVLSDNKSVDLGEEVAEEVIKEDDKIKIVIDTGITDNVEAIQSLDIRRAGDNEVLLTSNGETVKFILTDDSDIGSMDMESNNGIVTIEVPRDNDA